MQEADDRRKLDGLLGFASELLTARSSVQMEMKAGLGVFREADITGLPGVHLDVGDGSWLRIHRQSPGRPEAPPEHVALFMEGKSGDPDRPPTLQPAISIEVLIEEASDLAEAGLLRDRRRAPRA